MKAANISSDIRRYNADVEAIQINVKNAKAAFATARTLIAGLESKYSAMLGEVRAAGYGNNDNEKKNKDAVGDFEDDLAELDTACAAAVTALAGISFD